MTTMDFEIDFHLDANGRTVRPRKIDDEEDTLPNNVEESSMDFTSKTVQTSFQLPSTVDEASFLDDLLLDCEIADSGLMPRTFWVPSKDFEPRFHLEQMALDVFHHHTRGVDYDAATSGAEWWVQLRPSPEAGRYRMHDTGGSNDDMAKQGISFHWDKDEELRLLCGGTTYVHPHLSTVTYLTGIGAPTLVMNHRVNNLTGEYVAPSSAEGYLSWPLPTKHLSFDGRFLHAAPVDLMQSGEFSAQCQFEEPEDPAKRKLLVRRHRRCTFLVNVWVIYKPLGVEPFPATMVDKMTKAKDRNKDVVHLSFPLDDRESVRDVVVPGRPVLKDAARPEAREKEASSKVGSATVTMDWSLGDRDSTETIRVPMPLSLIRAEAPPSGTGNVRIKWDASSPNTDKGVETTPSIEEEPAPKRPCIPADDESKVS